LIRGQCVRVGEQQHVGLCRDSKLYHLVEWDLDFCNKLLPTIIIITIIYGDQWWGFGTSYEHACSIKFLISWTTVSFLWKTLFDEFNCKIKVQVMEFIFVY
jgi:hypothetical protein